MAEQWFAMVEQWFELPESDQRSYLYPTTAQRLLHDRSTIAQPTAVKICGVTQREQALAIAELGADCIGINFWPQSKRYLAPEEAASWMRDVPRSTRLIGVFVNPELEYVREIASTGLLSHIQLHGDETPEFCASLVEQGFKVL